MLGLVLEMDTCSVQIVVVSTRVDEQLISILRHSEERRKCLEPSNVMDLIAVCLSQFGPREDSLSKVVQRN